jgi:hypothetical protein
LLQQRPHQSIGRSLSAGASANWQLQHKFSKPTNKNCSADPTLDDAEMNQPEKTTNNHL